MLNAPHIFSTPDPLLSLLDLLPTDGLTLSPPQPVVFRVKRLSLLFPLEV